MVRNDDLFKTQLNYLIQANSKESDGNEPNENDGQENNSHYQLFSDVRKSILSFEAYDNYEVKEQPDIIEELGSYVIGGGNEEALKLTATFHESSTAIHPIISIRAYSLTAGNYLPNRDIVDLDTIFMQNASMMEVFAYLSYMDNEKGLFNNTFDRLVISNNIELDSLDDMYSTHFDLSVLDL